MRKRKPKPPRKCLHCANDICKPRIRICDTCRQSWPLYLGIWNRLKHSLGYQNLPYDQVLPWYEFRDFALTALPAFWKKWPNERPSVNRKNSDLTYLRENIEIIPKRLNSALLKSRCFKTAEQVRQVRRLKDVDK